MTPIRNDVHQEIQWAARRVVSKEVAEMIRDGKLTVEELTGVFMLSFVRCVRERTDWPQLNKRG
jgi:hypothetical protein